MIDECDPDDLDYLAWIAEGRAAVVPVDATLRLVAAGLVVQVGDGVAERQCAELSPAGLKHIRSSDQ